MNFTTPELGLQNLSKLAPQNLVGSYFSTDLSRPRKACSVLIVFGSVYDRRCISLCSSENNRIGSSYSGPYDV